MAFGALLADLADGGKGKCGGVRAPQAEERFSKQTNKLEGEARLAGVRIKRRFTYLPIFLIAGRTTT